MRHVSIGSLLMGGAMALMMLWMLHDTFMAGSGGLGVAGLLFVAGHIAVGLAFLGAALAFPGLRRRIRSHRPSPRHIATMIVGIAGTAGLAHIVLHSGAATWI